MSSFAATCAGCAVLAAAAAAPAPKAPQPTRTFYVVESGIEGWTVIDPQQIESSGGGAIRRAWSIRIVRNIMATPPAQPGYVRTQTDYDCQRREFRWREFTAFSRAGEPLVTRQNPTFQWESAGKSPDTTAALQIVCGQAGGRGVVSAASAAQLVVSLMASWDPEPPPAAALQKKAGAPAPAAAPPAKKPATPPPAPRPKSVSLNDLWP